MHDWSAANRCSKRSRDLSLGSMSQFTPSHPPSANRSSTLRNYGRATIIAGLFHYRNGQPGPAIEVEFVREYVRTRGGVCNAEGVERDFARERFVARALRDRAW